MTVIAILLAFTLCHFVSELGRMRRFQWLPTAVRNSQEQFGHVNGWDGAAGFLYYLGLPLLLISLVAWLFNSTLGEIGTFLVAVVVLVYCFGPHDLDANIEAIVHAADDEAQAAAVRDLLGSVPADPDSCQAKAIDAVFREALQRWFGTIFWFAVLGVQGAVLYRIADRINEGGLNLPPVQASLFRRLRQILDWPVAQLMTLALAIATDFDSVHKAWRKYHEQQGHGLFEGDNGFLYTSARQIVLSGHAARDGYADQLDGPLACLRQAMDLVWRILGVWLTVLAVLLLVDILA